MTWVETGEVEQYVDAAGKLLLADPVLHTVALTVVENARAQPDGTRFAWWQDGGEVTGAVSRTPPYPLLLSVVPDEAIAPLVQLFKPDAVSGPTALAAQVAAVAARPRGCQVELRAAERLHRLTALQVPSVPGAARVGTADDLELLVAWFGAFVAESGVIATDVERAVRERLTWNGFVLWEDGGPVALAGCTRQAFGTVRIGPVYTPPEHRGRGYGGAATAAMTTRASEAGAGEVVLFTDLTNPTSNALYARLGFAPVSDRAIMRISSA